MANTYLNRKDLFYVEFTKLFIPEDIEKFYRAYVDRLPTFVDSPRKLVESSLQGITVPSYQYDPVSQTGVDTMNKNTIETKYRSSYNMQDNTQKTLTCTFKLLNGYINYWILLDTFFFHNDQKTKSAYIGDISLRILDAEGLVMMTRKYKQCIITGISEFELSYSENIQTFETFNITLQYTVAETEFANPGNPIRFGNKVN